MNNILKSRKAMTLVEIMLAILILAIVVLGSSFMFVYGTGMIAQSKNYRVATELASQKLEYFRSENAYNIDINDVQEDESIALSEMTFTRHTEVEAQPEEDPVYKKVAVTVQWVNKGKTREVKLNTLYVKR